MQAEQLSVWLAKSAPEMPLEGERGGFLENQTVSRWPDVRMRVFVLQCQHHVKCNTNATKQ